MACVIGMVEQLHFHLRHLAEQVNALQKKQETSETAASEPVSRGFEPDSVDTTELQELRDEVLKLREEFQDSKSGHAASIKKERNVTEAVLTQKLDRMVGEKTASLSTRTESSTQTLDQLSKKVQAITMAVDKQAKFLTELTSKINQSIDGAVSRALTEHLQTLSAAGKQLESRGGPSEEIDTLEETLEESPDLSKDADGDQIEMTPAANDGEKSKPKARGKRKGNA